MTEDEERNYSTKERKLTWNPSEKKCKKFHSIVEATVDSLLIMDLALEWLCVLWALIVPYSHYVVVVMLLEF